mgnify:CR=1 FL=1
MNTRDDLRSFTVNILGLTYDYTGSASNSSSDLCNISISSIIANTPETNRTRSSVMNDDTTFSYSVIDIITGYGGWVSGSEDRNSYGTGWLQLDLQNVTYGGITNQRETTIIWDKTTLKPVYNAIVWQDRRTSAYCSEIATKNNQSLVKEKTGLLIDSYFSATKLLLTFRVLVISPSSGSNSLCKIKNLCI